VSAPATNPLRRLADAGQDVWLDGLRRRLVTARELDAYVQADALRGARPDPGGALRDRHRVAVTVGFGPRYVHSTGQLHKGGPAGGSFLQVVDAELGEDVSIPARRYTFGELLDAQAFGDLLALRRHGRAVPRVTLDQLEELA